MYNGVWNYLSYIIADTKIIHHLPSQLQNSQNKQKIENYIIRNFAYFDRQPYGNTEFIVQVSQPCFSAVYFPKKNFIRNKLFIIRPEDIL